MRCFSKDNEGLAPVLEYLFAFTVFILVLSLYFTALGTMFPSYNTETTHLEEKCLVVSEALMSNPGRIEGDTIEGGGTDEWETFSRSDLNHAAHVDLVSIGFCRDNESYGILEYDKIISLETKVDYATFTEAFSLTNNLAVRITVETLDNDIINSEFGAKVTGTSRDMVTVERFCVIQNNEAKVTGKLTVKLFYGGVIEQ